ncbi:hypothetical protein HUJ05_004685 [Dendroctonus ponderosae]|nr:hypothetical protein HUJ05_004685 [Dendroctonus ponderosae]
MKVYEVLRVSGNNTTKEGMRTASEALFPSADELYVSEEPPHQTKAVPISDCDWKGDLSNDCPAQSFLLSKCNHRKDHGVICTGCARKYAEPNVKSYTGTIETCLSCIKAQDAYAPFEKAVLEVLRGKSNPVDTQCIQTFVCMLTDQTGFTPFLNMQLFEALAEAFLKHLGSFKDYLYVWQFRSIMLLNTQPLNSEYAIELRLRNILDLIAMQTCCNDQQNFSITTEMERLLYHFDNVLMEHAVFTDDLLLSADSNLRPIDSIVRDYYIVREKIGFSPFLTMHVVDSICLARMTHSLFFKKNKKNEKFRGTQTTRPPSMCKIPPDQQTCDY